MRALRRMALIGCATLAACTFTVEGVGVGSHAPGGAAPGAPTTLDGGADAGSPSGPGQPTPTPTPPSTAPDYGAPCSATLPCSGGLTCLHQIGGGPGAIQLPDGYCTADCSQQPCQSGAVCIDFGKPGHFCMALCEGSCRTGYACCDVGDEMSACLAGSQCQSKT